MNEVREYGTVERAVCCFFQTQSPHKDTKIFCGTKNSFGTVHLTMKKNPAPAPRSTPRKKKQSNTNSTIKIPQGSFHDELLNHNAILNHFIPRFIQ